MVAVGKLILEMVGIQNDRGARHIFLCLKRLCADDYGIGIGAQGALIVLFQNKETVQMPREHRIDPDARKLLVPLGIQFTLDIEDRIGLHGGH